MTVRAFTTELETYSGSYIDLVNPDPDDVNIEDIARGLSMLCRFNGQVTRFYSVAEHAIRVAELVPQPLQYAALHHDSHEAYIGDWTSPLKWAIGADVVESTREELDKAIAIAMHIPFDMLRDPLIKEADTMMMYREAATLKYSHGTGEHWGNEHHYKPLVGFGWSPDRAEREFIKRHDELRPCPLLGRRNWIQRG